MPPHAPLRAVLRTGYLVPLGSLGSAFDFRFSSGRQSRFLGEHTPRIRNEVRSADWRRFSQSEQERHRLRFLIDVTKLSFAGKGAPKCRFNEPFDVTQVKTQSPEPCRGSLRSEEGENNDSLTAVLAFPVSRRLCASAFVRLCASPELSHRAQGDCSRRCRGTALP